MAKKQKGTEKTGTAVFNTNNDTEFAKGVGTKQAGAQQEKTGKAAFNTNNDLNK